MGGAGLVISSGDVYGDNFEIHTPDAISNHLQLVELDFTHAYETPITAADDQYAFF
ncbi:MAG: hypothetical protein V3V05_12300 [Pontiella sp.]